MEYIEMDYIRDIIREIEPSRSDYYGQNVGIAEQMVLDKQKEIAEELEELERYVIDIDEDVIANGD